LAALRQGRLDVAEELGGELLAIAPSAPATHQLLATLALQRGDHEAAARWALSCLDRRPDSPPALILAGRAARGRGDLAEATRFFRLAAECAPQRADAVFLLCAVLLERGDPQANEMLGDLLRRFPREAGGWREIGRMLRKAGQLEAALLAFTRAAKAAVEPRDELERAMILQALGRSAESVDVLRTASGRFPACAEISLQLARALQTSGAFAAARSELEKVLANEPANTRAAFALGLVCQDSHDIPAAIAAYRKTLDLQPGLAEAYVNLGICLQLARDMTAAKAAYGPALRQRADTFGRVAQALPAAPMGELWLNPDLLRRSLEDRAGAAGTEISPIDSRSL
jgi:tetratricopeptide (TPR) repeat protein